MVIFCNNKKCKYLFEHQCTKEDSLTLARESRECKLLSEYFLECMSFLAKENNGGENHEEETR